MQHPTAPRAPRRSAGGVLRVLADGLPGRRVTAELHPPAQPPPPAVAARTAGTPCADGLLDDLRALLAGDPRAGSLLVRYQPVVRACDAEPLGAEALVRWWHPERGLLAPDTFVGLAEATGLGPVLDEQVLRCALRQVAAWDAASVRVHRVGVNLGRSSVQRPDLADVVDGACADTGIGHDRLMIEVVEHDQLDLEAVQLAGLQRLADAGVTIAIDDFGSGCAGVGYLARLPIGVVKVDRSLMPGSSTATAAGAPRPEDLLRGLVALARAVGAEVTAEGVETEHQQALLVDVGIPHAQGWLFAAALDPADVPSHWRRWASTARSTEGPVEPVVRPVPAALA